MRLTIARLGHRGDGVAEGILVPLALPGEVVEGELSDGRMVAPKIVTPSSDRVRPPCGHFRSCGGCVVQHASDGFVAGWKQEVVTTALAAQGLHAPMRPVLTSPPRSRRRAALSGRRTKKGAIVGLHGRASDTLVAIPGCQLLHPDLMALIPALEAIVTLGATRKGEMSLVVTRSDSGADVAARGGKPLDPALRAELAALTGRWAIARLSWDGETVALHQLPVQRFGSAEVAPPPGAFLQATAEGEAALVAAVTEAVGSARRVADLFAGCGTFALPLARQAELHAVEGEAAMLQALDRGWRAAEGLRRVTHEARDLFRRPLMAEELRRFDAVVIDPPRAGAEAQVAQLAASDVPVIAMVSCNPVTFARDARTLVSAGHSLEWVQVVDQFRWSSHVELAARFTKGHIRRD
ncbi:class I SAM-dependent RNA methyltransferase [Plastorhodobacter daqingensis]|uniref:Class I SAM-dependent RNA methyltransferase n=1 Tax=Plastorhodobacter daqingensis TaxID=1387281 RepID=A0ABW2UDE7_9RHOB